MELLLSLVIVPLLLLICTLSFQCLRNAVFSKNLPPGPTGIPILGSLLAVGDRPHETLAALAKVHGPLMTVQLGLSSTVVASSAETVREILVNQGQAFLGRSVPQAVTAQNNHHGGMTWVPADSRWKRLRKICNTQIFNQQMLDAREESRRQVVIAMLKRVTKASEAKEAIDIRRLLFGTTANLLANTIFSAEILDPESEAIREIQMHAAKTLEMAAKPNLADHFPFLKAFDPQGIKKEVKVSFDRLEELFDEAINQRLERKESNKSARHEDFMDVLIDLAMTDAEFSLQDAKVLLAELFVGATETNVSTVEWAMAELIRSPQIMAKAKQELIKTMASEENVEERELLQLPYLQSVIKEAMRLHPAAALLLPHRAETDAEVCGYTIPKYTRVVVNSWALGRDPMYWENPSQFLPERFMKAEMSYRGTHTQFIPFGAGRRICPGLPFAQRILSLVLACLIHHFDWKLPDGITPENMDMSETFRITLAKSSPLLAIPVVAAAAK